MTVIVYTKPACPQCDMTKSLLTRNGIAFEAKDLTKDPAAMSEIEALQPKGAPVVVAGDKHWWGFRPDLIGGLVPAHA